MTSLHAILPSAALEKASASEIKSNFGSSGLDWFALNAATPSGSAFADILNSVSPSASANATPSNDPVAQLTALLQNGTSLSTIVKTIAQNVSASVPQGLRSSVLQSITDALSPPSNAPPGTATQQVTALAARLQQLISALARGTPVTAGQQNEISGNILDATSAKELPAQQKTNDTSSTLDVSSFVQSILSNTVVALQGAAVSTTATPASSTPATPAKSSRPVSLPIQTAPAPTVPASSVANVATSPAPPVQPASPGVTPASAQPPADAGPASAITMANAPDLLARMLVRAAGADPTFVDNAAAAVPTANGGTDSTLSLSAIAARLSNAIGDGAASASASQNGSAGGNLFGHGFSANDQASPASTQSTSSGASEAVAATGTNAQLQNLLQPQQASASGVDVSSVIEQMIKSMSMRTNSQGSSTIQLHLQPENLGDVTMRITVTGTQINANVVAQNADVRNALVSNHQQLTKSLADAGLTLTGFSVDVSGGDAKQQNQGQTSGFGRRYVVHELGGNAPSEGSTVSNLGPPLLSGSGLGLFNYLA